MSSFNARPVRAIVYGVVLVLLLLARLFHWGGAPARSGPAPGAPAPSAASQPGAPAGGSPAPVAVDANVGFRSADRLAEHFAKHGGDFPGASQAEYLRQAQVLRDRPAGGDVLELVRADGVTCRFDEGSGAFLAFNRDRTIRTFFKPNDGENYFRRQADRPADAR